MKPNRAVVAVGAFTLLLYLAAIGAGIRLKTFSFQSPHFSRGMGWRSPSSASIPNNATGDSIRRGALIFDQTSLFASANVGGKLSCSDCHAEGGMQPYAAPMVDLPAHFPTYSKRAGRKISLQQRIQECFARSENGTPPDNNGATMNDIVAYINWLSQPQPNHKPYHGRGLIHLPNLKPNPVHGQQIYATQCAGCHGDDGLGRAPMFPPLWGPDSFNDGAGMNKIPQMAAFVEHNMPQNRMGILTSQEAYDVSAFIHMQPRPALNQAYKHY